MQYIFSFAIANLKNVLQILAKISHHPNKNPGSSTGTCECHASGRPTVDHLVKSLPIHSSGKHAMHVRLGPVCQVYYIVHLLKNTNALLMSMFLILAVSMTQLRPPSCMAWTFCTLPPWHVLLYANLLDFQFPHQCKINKTS